MTDEILQEFEDYLRIAVVEMINPEIPFTNKPEAKYTLFDMNAEEVDNPS
jgi:hypothetical protein